MLYAEDVRAPNYVHDRLLLPHSRETKGFSRSASLSLCRIFMLSLQLSAVRKIPKSIVKGCFSYSSLFRILQGETEWEIEIFTTSTFFLDDRFVETNMELASAERS